MVPMFSRRRTHAGIGGRLGGHGCSCGKAGCVRLVCSGEALKAFKAHGPTSEAVTSLAVRRAAIVTGA